MLSTKDMSVGSGTIKPVIGTGNHKVKINSITFDQTPYDADAFNIMLHVESEPVSGEFNGFLKDMNNPNGERYTGQVGRGLFAMFIMKVSLGSNVLIEVDFPVPESAITNTLCAIYFTILFITLVNVINV